MLSVESFQFFSPQGYKTRSQFFCCAQDMSSNSEGRDVVAMATKVFESTLELSVAWFLTKYLNWVHLLSHMGPPGLQGSPVSTHPYFQLLPTLHPPSSNLLSQAPNWHKYSCCRKCQSTNNGIFYKSLMSVELFLMSVFLVRECLEMFRKFSL